MALGSDAGACMVGHGSGIEEEYRAFREVFPSDERLVPDLLEGQKRLEAFCAEKNEKPAKGDKP